MKTIICLLGLVLHSCSHGVVYWFRSRGKTGEDLDSVRGKTLHSFLVTMGPVYIKLGQIMSTRSDLFPPAIIAWLQKLQDDVPPMRAEDTREALSRAYGGEAVFGEFSDAPVASASIAQVHEAVLSTGERVAVKIVKKGVKESLIINLGLLNRLLSIADWAVRSLRPLQLPSRFKDFRALLLRQTDMVREAEDMEAIRSNFEGHPFVTIPEAYLPYCRENILVMQFVSGIPGRDHHKVQLPPKELAHRVIEVMMSMVYLHGFFHADAHPGNLFFTEDGRIILLDFGLTEKLDEDEKWELASFYYAVTRQEWDLATERYTRAFVVDRWKLDDRWDAYERDMSACLQKHFEAKDKWDTAEFANDTIEIFEKHGVRESTHYTKIELTMVTMEGFVVQIDPDLDVWEASRSFNDRYSLFFSERIRNAFDEYFESNIPESLALEKKADEVLVAPTHLNRFCLQARYPVFIKSAHGCVFEDVDGNEYIELHGGYGPYILGYAHPVVQQAIKETVEQGVVCALGNRPEVSFMEMLVDAIPAAEKGLFCNSGTEGCNIAIKLCRAARKRQMVAKCEGHYHGFLDQGTVSSWFRVRGPLEAPLPIAGSAGCSDSVTDNTIVLQYGHPKTIDQIREHADQLACVIVEPVASNMVIFDEQWLRDVRQVCTENDVPLIFDEVVTGFRVAYGGMQSVLNIQPDLTVLGKIIGGGLPCGAVVGKAEIIDKAKRTGDPFTDYEEIAFAGGTLAGNTLSCAAGQAQVSYLKEHPEIYPELDRKTNRLIGEMADIIDKFGIVCEVGGYMSMFTLTFRPSKPKYYRDKFGSDLRSNVALAYYMRQAHVYMAELHTYFIGNAHTDDDLDKVLGAFESSLALMQQEGIFAD